MELKVELKLEPTEDQIVGEFDFPPLRTTEPPTPRRQSPLPEIQKPQVVCVKSENPHLYGPDKNQLNIKKDTVTCPNCDLEFTPNSDLKCPKHHCTRKRPRQQKKTKEKVSLTCGICSKEGLTPHNYHRHMLSHRGPIKCDECGSGSHTFRNIRTLKKHLIIRHGHRLYTSDSHYVRTFACEICLKVFNNKATYLAHLRIHMKDRPMYQCTLCPSKLSTKFSYVSHMKNSHSGCPDLVCDICGAVMKFYYLAHHKKLQHQNKVTYSCSECPATFLGKPFFLKHCFAHTSGKLNCRFCNKAFKTGAVRISHERQHHCPRYRKKISSRSSKIMTRSLEIMICDQCDKPCKGRHSLKSHILSLHTNKYNFICDICGLQIKLRSHLTEHLLRHQGRFIFHCDADGCGKARKSRIGLFKHWTKHHLGKPKKTKYEIEMEKTVDETVRYAMQGLYDDYFDSKPHVDTKTRIQRASRPTQFRRQGLVPLAPKIPSSNQPIQISQMTKFQNRNSVPQTQVPMCQILILNQHTQVQNLQNSSAALPVLQKGPDFAKFDRQNNLGGVMPKEEDQVKGDQIQSSINYDHEQIDMPSLTLNERGVGKKYVGNPSMIMSRSSTEQLVNRSETSEPGIFAPKVAIKIVEQTIPLACKSFRDKLQTMPNLTLATTFAGTNCDAKIIDRTNSAGPVIRPNPVCRLPSAASNPVQHNNNTNNSIVNIHAYESSVSQAYLQSIYKRDQRGQLSTGKLSNAELEVVNRFERLSKTNTSPATSPVLVSKRSFPDHGSVVRRKTPTSKQFAPHGRLTFPKQENPESFKISEKVNQANHKSSLNSSMPVSNVHPQQQLQEREWSTVPAIRMARLKHRQSPQLCGEEIHRDTNKEVKVENHTKQECSL